MKDILCVCDADGTLFDSHESVMRTWQQIGQQFGKDTFDDMTHFEDVLSKNTGPWEQCVQREFGFTDDQVSNMYDLFRKLSLGNYQKYTKWYEGARELLHEIEKRGAKIGIATNNMSHNFQDLLLDFGNHYPVYDFDTHGVDRIKPQPDMIHDHISLYQDDIGKQPDRVFMVGDSVSDMQAGRNAGVVTVWAQYGSFQHESQLEGLCDHILEDSIKNLLDIIDR